MSKTMWCNCIVNYDYMKLGALQVGADCSLAPPWAVRNAQWCAARLLVTVCDHAYTSPSSSSLSASAFFNTLRP